MRGSQPGERRGGRQKGTPNKRTLEVIERLAQLNCDPVEGLARLAMNSRLNPELRLRAYAELLPYCFPRRRAVEHSVCDDSSAPATFIFDLTADQEQEAYLRGMRAAAQAGGLAAATQGH